MKEYTFPKWMLTFSKQSVKANRVSKGYTAFLPWMVASKQFSLLSF